MAASSLKLSQVPAAVQFGKRFYEQSGYPGEFNPKIATEFLYSVVQDEDSVAILAQDKDGPTGLLCATVQRSFASPVILAYDLLFIAAKGSGKELVEFYEKWAKLMGASEAYLSSSTGEDPTAIERLYKSYGFSPVGIVAKKEV